MFCFFTITNGQILRFRGKEQTRGKHTIMTEPEFQMNLKAEVWSTTQSTGPLFASKISSLNNPLIHWLCQFQCATRMASLWNNNNKSLSRLLHSWVIGSSAFQNPLLTIFYKFLQGKSPVLCPFSIREPVLLKSWRTFPRSMASALCFMDLHSHWWRNRANQHAGIWQVIVKSVNANEKNKEQRCKQESPTYLQVNTPDCRRNTYKNSSIINHCV